MAAILYLLPTLSMAVKAVDLEQTCNANSLNSLVKLSRLSASNSYAFIQACFFLWLNRAKVVCFIFASGH